MPYLLCILVGCLVFSQKPETPRENPTIEPAKLVFNDKSPKTPSHKDLTPLMAAAESGNKDAAKELLADGADPNEKNSSGRGALHIAARVGHDDMVSLLVEAGAKPEARDQEKVTPLMLAASSGNQGCFTFLFQWTKKPNAKDKQKKTLLHYAAMGGNPDIVTKAMELVKSIGVKDKYGNTPLMAAASAGQHDIIKFLVDHGAEINRRNRIGDTALHLAAKHGHVECIAGLIDMGLDIDEKGRDHVTPLMAAVLANQVDAVKLLMDLGANPRRTDRYGDSPIEYIHFLRNREMYLLICETGWPGAALHCVTRKGDVKQAMTLVGEGAPINARNPMGETPLFVAVSEGWPELADRLLRQGADPEAPTDYFWTPLYVAAWRGDQEAVQILLDAGANANQPVGGGDTPLGAALAGSHFQVAELLLKAGAEVLYYLPETKEAASFRDMALKRLKAAHSKGLENGSFAVREAPFWLRSYTTSEVTSLATRDSTKKVEPPLFTHKVRPRYPRAASQEKLQGNVIIEAILGKDRRIRDIKVLRPFKDWHYGFEVEAIRALQQWKFVPAKVENKEVDLRITLKIDFIFR